MDLDVETLLAGCRRALFCTAVNMQMVVLIHWIWLARCVGSRRSTSLG